MRVISKNPTCFSGWIVHKYEWDCDMVEEDLEESDISTHDNYIELYFCKKYKPFGE